MNRIMVMFLAIIMIGSFPLPFPSPASSLSITPSRSDTNRTYVSVGGTELIDDAANVRIIGETQAVTGSDLGTFSFVGDVNTDGIPDLAVAAPGMPGLAGHEDDGRIYVFYGDGERPDPLIDLDRAEPDLVIYGNAPVSFGNKLGLSLATGMLAEDIDGDGLNDLAICCPSNEKNPILVLIYCPGTGWPEWISITLSDNIYLRFIPLNELLHTDEYVDSADGPLFSTISKSIGGFNRGSDSRYSPFLKALDIDRDGYLDIVGGGCYTPTYTKMGVIYYHYYGNVRIIWGANTTEEMDLSIIWKEQYDRFGFSMDVGDIDNDGNYDLVVGTPLGSTDSLRQCGNVSVYFNITGLRDVHMRYYDVDVRTVIHGSGNDDELGTCILLKDLTGDGKDDIIASAPNTDGPGDDTPDCGGIFIFDGKPELGFPSEMDAESGFDSLILGDDEPVNRQGIGFQLGREFVVTDLSGDGAPDLLTSVMGADLPPIGADPRYKAGIVLFYDNAKVFKPGIVRLDNPSGLYTLEGMDIEDCLGFYLDAGDLDGDGIDDVFAGAPAADGIGNDRPRCGEMFIVYSSHLRIGDLSLTGEGFEEGVVHASGGRVRFTIPIANERPQVPLIGLSVRIGDALLDIGSALSIEDPLGTIADPQGGISMTDRRGSVWFEAEMTWSFPVDGTDIVLTVRDAEGCLVTRTYRDAFFVARDLSFGEGGTVTVNGRERTAGGTWVGMGDAVAISGIPIIYTGTSREVQDGKVLIRIEGDGPSATVPYTGTWSYDDVIRTSPLQEYELGIELAEPPPIPPDLEKDMKVRFLVDDSPPDTPDVHLYQDSVGGIGKRGEWSIEVDGGFGPDFDGGGSGIREYRLMEEGYARPIVQPGSLLATYYSDLGMEDPVLMLHEDGIDHDWGPWGPYPEEQVLPPSGFSARWHGHFRVEASGQYNFELRGRGQGMMMIDGGTIIPLDDLEFAPGTGDMEITSGDLHEIVLYYFHTDPSKPSAFSLWWMDNNGTVETVPSRVLYGPSNRTTVPIEDRPDATRRVVAVDWVGLVSGEGTAVAELDLDIPSIDASSIPVWTNESTPTFRIEVADDTGADPSSLRYRLLEEGETFGTWVSEDIRFDDIVEISDRTVSFTAIFSPSLGPGFRGTIDIEVTDIAGNVGRSGPKPLGVDTRPPTFMLVSPYGGEIVGDPPYDLVVKAQDIRGSGIDLSTVSYRIGSGGTWGEWTPVMGNGSAEEWTIEQELLLPQGIVNVQYMARDMAANLGTAAFEFTVTVPPENMPPVPVISSPANGTRFSTGTLVDLSGAGTRDDGIGLYDPVRMTWYSNISGYLGSGVRVKVTLEPGVNRITLYADDGAPGHNVSAWIEIRIGDPQVTEDGEGGSQEDRSGLAEAILVLILCIVLVSGLAVMVVLYQRNRRVEETRLEVHPEE